MDEILEIKALSKSYGHIGALEQLDLTVNHGEVYGILGPNGSGKTTTLAMILGIIRPTGGTFRWSVTSDNKQFKRNIGALLETPNFYPYLSIEKNLSIVCTIKGIPESDIEKVLQIVNLYSRKNSHYSTLSLGMKQRLSLASLLLGDPDVLILDEPGNGLDPEGIAEVRNIIKSEVARGKTIIMASHILDEVEKVCTHVAILKKGKLVASGKVHELLGAGDSVIISTKNNASLYETIVRQGFCKSVDMKGEDIVMVLSPDYSPAFINDFAFKNGHILSKLEVKKKSLESQFLEIVK